MPEYLSPGVYVEEIEVGTKPIEGVATSNLGIVGPTERGPLGTRLVTSWLEFQRVYGGAADSGPSAPGRWFLADAARGFFQNGGRRCFVSRVVALDDASDTTADGADSATLILDSLLLSAVGPGAWGNNVLVRVADPAARDPNDLTQPHPERFRLVVAYYTGVPNSQNTPPLAPDPLNTFAAGNFVDPSLPQSVTDPNYRAPAKLEIYEDLSFHDGDPNYVLRALRASNLITATWTAQGPGRPQNSNSNNSDFVALSGGTDGHAADPSGYRWRLHDFEGEERQESRNGEVVSVATGLLGLEQVDEVTMLAAPDEHHTGLAALRSRVVEQCERLRDRFALFSVEQGQRDVQSIRPDPPTSYAALYWPWIFVTHPNGRDRMLVPPVGHMAGIYARTDVERGVHKAPANEVVRGALDLEFPVSRGMHDILNPRGVNVIRDFRPDGRGIRAYGARTMTDNPIWKYVNVRRLFLFLEESIDEGTQWVVFEPNSEPLWDRVRRSIESFLITVWRNGALMGTRQEEAFYVKCDRTTMTQDDLDNGRLICYIGVAPVKPAEFVIFRIHQWTLEAGTPV